VVCRRLRELVGDSQVGAEGVNELEEISELLDCMGPTSERVMFDPTVVRGLGYYTGPVFEAALTFEVEDETGEKRSFGSVAGGGRYDDLVQRFTGKTVHATGASIGVDRLLAALKNLNKLDRDSGLGPVVVTVMERQRLPEYQRMVSELREAGIAAELYLGEKGFRAQMKYADKRRSPAVVIAGEDEFGRGEVAVKDMRLGLEISKQIEDRDEWRKGQPAQTAIPRTDLVKAIKAIVAR
jgi:histidyl-tRNA synthetase